MNLYYHIPPAIAHILSVIRFELVSAYFSLFTLKLNCIRVSGLANFY